MAMSNGDYSMAPRTFAHSKIEAVNAQLRAAGRPEIEVVGPVRGDTLSHVGDSVFDESSLDDLNDRCNTRSN